MSRRLTRRRAVATGATLTALLGLNRTSPGGGDDSSPPVTAIRAVLDRQVADWNRGDLDGFVTGYWNSPELVFQSGGHRTDGYDGMVARYRKRYQADGKAMGKLVFSGVEVLPLGADSAFVRGAWRLTMPDGLTPGGLFTLIFRRFPEGWKIVHDHTSAEDPPRPK
ncbi:YybH family protein [Aquisphaera insulae]|uniref:YybH family protein n=1 Tax=Aquisphaera insulae TaxID=2712864 RepID=UPI0013ED9D96|nr:nuclear transport factor 2 family protein [Aquisphaera insulae]